MGHGRQGNHGLDHGFRALPITDENDIIAGVVPYRDVLNLKHRILESRVSLRVAAYWPSTCFYPAEEYARSQ